MKLVLGIEVSNPDPSSDASAIALARVDEHGEVNLLASQPMKKSARGADSVMSMIDEVCASAGISPNKLDAIAISVGPGGYTALRIATTSAKVLARTLGCSIIGVQTAWVAAGSIPDSDCPALISLASKGELAWCAQLCVDEDGQRSMRTLGVVDSASAELEGVRCVFADSHLPAPFAARCDVSGVRIRPIRLDALACIRVALDYDPIDPDALTPLYAREPDAVTQWRDRYGDVPGSRTL